MKAVFENLEAEVDQNETDLRSDSVLNVSRFSNMHDTFTSAQKRIADLESENFNLRNKIQKDDHDKYGYIKNHKKTVKNGQTRTQERKSVQELEAKSNWSNLGQQ
ncbi:hypothetical protein Tco_0998922, partial [Tanacetum coccineum]